MVSHTLPGLLRSGAEEISLEQPPADEMLAAELVVLFAAFALVVPAYRRVLHDTGAIAKTGHTNAGT